MNVKEYKLKSNYRDILKMDISLYAVSRKVLSELNLQVVEHGDRVAYLYLKLAQYRGLPFDTLLRNMMIA